METVACASCNGQIPTCNLVVHSAYCTRRLDGQKNTMRKCAANVLCPPKRPEPTCTEPRVSLWKDFLQMIERSDAVFAAEIARGEQEESDEAIARQLAAQFSATENESCRETSFQLNEDHQPMGDDDEFAAFASKYNYDEPQLAGPEILASILLTQPPAADHFC